MSQRPSLYTQAVDPEYASQQARSYSYAQSTVVSPGANPLYPLHQQGFVRRPEDVAFQRPVQHQPYYQPQRTATVSYVAHDRPPAVPPKPQMVHHSATLPPISSHYPQMYAPAATSAYQAPYQPQNTTQYYSQPSHPQSHVAPVAVPSRPPSAAQLYYPSAIAAPGPPSAYQQALPPPPPPAPAPIPEEQPAPMVDAGQYVESPTEDAEELARVLELSKSEMDEEERLRQEEEEMLALAMAESLKMASARTNPFWEPDDTVASSSRTMVEHLPASAPSSASSASSAVEPPKRTASPPPTITTTFTLPPVESEPALAVHTPYSHYDKWKIPGITDLASSPVPLESPSTEPLVDGEDPDTPTTPRRRPELEDGSDFVQPITVRRSPSPVDDDDDEDTELAYMCDYGAEEEDAEELESAHVETPTREDRPLSELPLPGITISRQASLPPYEDEDDEFDDGLDSFPESERVLLPTNATLVFNDEEYAQQLAAEEGEEQAKLWAGIGQMSTKDREAAGDSLPQYAAAMEGRAPVAPIPEKQRLHLVSGPSAGPSSQVASSSSSYPLPSSSIAPNPAALPPAQSLLFSQAAPPADVAAQRPPSQSLLFSQAPPSGLISSSEDRAYEAPQDGPPPLGRPQLSVDTTRPPLNHASASEPGPSVSRPSIHPVPNRFSVSSPPSALPTASTPVNANLYIDRSLLMGISIGFVSPVVTPDLQPMTAPMPNIITLPYARCPPLHLMAPSWSHLLMLMARLSGTRIEAAVDAMAIAKTDLKLRTVVQFLRLNANSDDWRAILWFSIDHPIPPAAPSATKYLTPNPNLLPWSYNHSIIPKLLQDAAETSLSKTYTIPASDTLPLPTLPIDFPALALYLHAALGHSRRAGDGVYSKLSRMVHVSYPRVEQEEQEFDVPGRKKMSRVVDKLFGRKEKKKGKGTSNNEVYQLVTPFVSDGWG